jgi:VIT1/CCC1 family predicted Fe2+/Mn2+ transporter
MNDQEKIQQGIDQGDVKKVEKRVAKDYLPDFIYGSNDGIITTFAIVASVVGAALESHIVLILGLASLVADGLSMAGSSYLSVRSEVEEAKRATHIQAFKHGAATFFGFIIAGLMPLLAYVFPFFEGVRFPVAIGLTLLTLFVFGAGRALVAKMVWWKAGLEMLLIGAFASAVAYGIGILGSRFAGAAFAV